MQFIRDVVSGVMRTGVYVPRPAQYPALPVADPVPEDPVAEGPVPEDPGPEEEEDANIPPEHELLVRIAGGADADSLDQDSYLARMGNLADGRPLTLEMARSISGERSQKNMMENLSIAGDSMVSCVAPPQFGKTNSAVLFTAWSTGVRRGTPAMLVSHNGSREGRRLAGDVKKFNKFIREIARLLHLEAGSYPLLKFCDGGSQKGEDEFVAVVREGRPNEIPIYVTMGNHAKITKMKSVITRVSRYVGTDYHHNGPLKMLLIVDEADLTVQAKRLTKKSHEDGTTTTVLKPGQFVENLKTPVDVDFYTQTDEYGRPNFAPGTHDTVFDCFTSIVYVTATPQALVLSERGFPRGRHTTVVSGEPSRHYWAVVKKEGWNCKVISNRVAAGWEEMVDDMMKPENADDKRHALVAVPSVGNGTTIIDSQRTMAMDAVKHHPDIMSCAWYGEGVTVYTTSDRWVTRFEGTGAFDDPVAEGTSGGKDVWRFTSKKGNLKMPESSPELQADGKIKDVVVPGAICSYPSLMSFIYTFPVDIPNTVLFALNMTLRCTPVKGFDHNGPLTDMYTNVENSNDEFIAQLVGRVCGNDLRTQEQGKIIWASHESLRKIYRGMCDLPFLVDKLDRGVSIVDACRELEREIRARNGESVVDAEGATSTRLGKRTRAKITDDAANTQRWVRSRASQDNVQIEGGAPFPSGLVVPGIINLPVAQPEVAQPAAAQPVVAPTVVAPMVLEDPDANQRMSEVIEGHGAALAIAMVEIVRNEGGRVTVTRMSEVLSEHDNFPDGADFNITVFVRRLAGVDGLLDGVGLVFDGGVFTSSGRHITGLCDKVTQFIVDNLSTNGGQCLRRDIIRDFIVDDGIGTRCWEGWVEMTQTQKNGCLRSYFKSIERDGKLAMSGIVNDITSDNGTRLIKYTFA